MKTVISVLLLSLGAISLAPAANQAPASSDEQALLQLENDCEAARMRRDVEATDRIVDPTWMFTNPDGVLIPTAKANENLRTGFITFKSSKVESVSVHIYGDAAVVFSLRTQTLVLNGADVQGQFRCTNTFVTRGGHWRCVATHLTRVAAS